MRLYEVDRKKLDIRNLRTPAVMELKQAMEAAGHEVRIVGGAVRDLVLGKEPKDIDMATDATPSEMIEIFKAAGIRFEPTGLQHGTLTVILDGEPIEITTLRIDTETDGRHAEVEFTRDWKTDAERRDLTYNAMSVDLDGNLYDYFGGVDDLRAGRSKFVGDASKRMEEDFLRILRYFRFQGRMSKPSWDRDTLRTIKKKAEGLTQISGERVWMEVSKILAGNNSVDVINKMKLTGVDQHISLPTDRVSELARVRQHTTDPVVNLVALLGDFYDLEEIKARCKISNAEYNKAKFILDNRHVDFEAGFVKRALSQPKANREHIMALAEYLGHEEMINLINSWSVPHFPITGADLQDAGVEPGPRMGQILRALRKEWEDSDYMLDKQALISKL